jgi:Ca-activated chloride channel family protein
VKEKSISLVSSDLPAQSIHNDSAPGKVVVTAAIIGLILSVQSNGKDGIQLYNEGDYEGALRQFQEQLKSNPDSPAANFNAGDAAYRLKKFDQAFEGYSKAMLSTNLDLRERAYYNAGNTLFRKGDNSEEIEQQLSSYYDARYQYHQAMDLDPRDEQARKNLNLLEERIKQTEKQKQERQQQERQQRKRQPRNEHDSKKNSKPSQNGEGQKPGQPQQPDPGGDQQDDQSSPRDQSQEPDGGSANEPQRDPDKKKEGQLGEVAPSDPQQKPLEQMTEPGRMSETEALGLLDSLKNEGERVDLMRRKNERGTLRDW